MSRPNDAPRARVWPDYGTNLLAEKVTPKGQTWLPTKSSYRCDYATDGITIPLGSDDRRLRASIGGHG